MIKSQCYQQLHYEERIAIASFQAQGLSIRATARILNRAASTIGRAILRNAPSGQYSCMFAQKRRNRRRVFCRAAPKLGLVYKRGSCGRRRYCYEIGPGYLRLGQPATEPSGGEAQRIKLATELQRKQLGNTLCELDEPTTGLHPSDVDKLLVQLDGQVAAGNTVIVVEHDMRVVAQSDWVIDVGPGAGADGGQIVAAETPQDVAKSKFSKTAPVLAEYLSP